MHSVNFVCRTRVTFFGILFFGEIERERERNKNIYTVNFKKTRLLVSRRSPECSDCF